MARRNWLVGFVVGLVVGILSIVVLSGGQDVPQARAQSPAAAAPDFWISTWAHPPAFGPNGASIAASHGAYILDTRRGRVWLTKDGGKLQEIGQAASRVPSP